MKDFIGGVGIISILLGCGSMEVGQFLIMFLFGLVLLALSGYIGGIEIEDDEV